MKPAWRAVDGVLLLDKPAGDSSNRVLQRVRHLYRAEKAGHTGSLDPLATGLLPICLGEATKIAGQLLDSDKRYTVRAKLGEKTSTADREGDVIAQSDAAAVRREHIEALVPRFTGAQKQIPPMVSALKHQGERLYELARRGEEVVREPRDIVIHELQLTGFESPCFDLEVRCSKGTYIRSLVEDMAAAIGQYAHVTVLRRTALAPFNQPHMLTWEQLEQTAAAGLEALDALLLPPATALAHRPSVRVDEAQARRLAQGQAVQLAQPAPGAQAVLNAQGHLLGLAEGDAQGKLMPRRWLVAGQKSD